MSDDNDDQLPDVDLSGLEQAAEDASGLAQVAEEAERSVTSAWTKVIGDRLDFGLLDTLTAADLGLDRLAPEPVVPEDFWDDIESPVDLAHRTNELLARIAEHQEHLAAQQARTEQREQLMVKLMIGTLVAATLAVLVPVVLYLL